MADAPAANQPADAQPAKGRAVDIKKLADKVYRLMLADLRLDQARGAPLPRSKR